MIERIEFVHAQQVRLRKFVVSLVRFYQSLPTSGETKIIGNQLLRSGSSIGANYRAACRARSKDEFFSKMCIVVEEADETVYWLEIIKDAKMSSNPEFPEIFSEAEQILKMMAKARRNIYPPKT